MKEILDLKDLTIHDVQPEKEGGETEGREGLKLPEGVAKSSFRLTTNPYTAQ